MSEANSWQPEATTEGLKRRAEILNRTRQFFTERDVLEVETPIACAYGVTEAHIQNLGVSNDNQRWWLRSSPEYHMKRLLAAGCPDIYQIGKAFRGGECGSRHEAEFTLVEWYRREFTLAGLRDECCELIFELSRDARQPVSQVQIHSYREVFIDMCAIDPLDTDIAALKTCAKRLLGEQLHETLGNESGMDAAMWLDLLASHIIYPSFETNRLIVVTDFPQDQAMLARLKPENPELADRFEIFLNGIELANGFHELGDATEQAMRFESDRRRRRQLSLPDMLPDQKLLGALSAGLPDCCGVAVGLDRIIMVTDKHERIRSTMSFAPGS